MRNARNMGHSKGLQPQPPHGILALCLLTVAVTGCTRMQYRRAADRQTYRILAEKGDDPRWSLPRLDITPDPRSRFFDPNDPDFPPLPPDDPAAHEYMHRAYGMRGWKRWHDFGQTDHVENPQWPVFLGGKNLAAADGSLPAIKKVTLANAIELGLIPSREYQEQLENVYLSALALTFERYKFDVRPRAFLGEPGTQLFYEHQPDDASRLGLGPTNLGVRKLFPTGAQLIAEITNNTLWMFAGPNASATATSFAYSIVQPLLAGASREIVMEDLTQAERNVLYAIRKFARFRKDFYVMVVTGERAAPLPGSPGGAELAFLIRGERSPTVGFNKLLFLHQYARNQAENVKSLERRLLDVQAMYRQGKATSLDVTQVRSSLENARVIYLWRARVFEDQLDRFKLQLGLPPDLELEIDDTMLEPFRFRNPRLAALEDRLRGFDTQIGELRQQTTRDRLKHFVEELIDVRRELSDIFGEVEHELGNMDEVLAVRRRQMTEDEIREFNELQVKYVNRLEGLRGEFENDRDILHRFATRLAEPAPPLAEILNRAVQSRDALTRIVRRLVALETAVRAELVVLPAVDTNLTPAKAVELAIENRLDLMNRRAVVMDARRRLEIAADRLEATLDIVAEGEVSTPPLAENTKPLDFRSDQSNFRVGIAVKTPLDRRKERNDFRAAQIAYQRARRNYMAAEDQVKLDVRYALRRVRQEARAFEVQRRALRYAAEELQQALEGDGKANDGTAGQQGLNIPRALSNIRRAQDFMIEAWMDYERARLTLFRDMGTMKINEKGLWPEEDQRRWAGLQQ
ncbi:MAG: TolC family protein [Planctomycetes bacterium]|nr:TolC family protein [Planctomycetota bacterium]